MTDKKSKSVLHGFIEIVDETKYKPNILGVDQGGEFYNKLMQKWLDDNILMYSTHNEGKSVVAERFIGTFKGKIFKQMTADNSKYYLDYLDKLVDQYSNTYHRSTGKKPIY